MRVLHFNIFGKVCFGGGGGNDAKNDPLFSELNILEKGIDKCCIQKPNSYMQASTRARILHNGK